jgi:hypothetical protein
VRLNLFRVLAVHFLEESGAPETSWIKVHRRRHIRLRTGRIGLAEFVLRIRIGKQLLISLRSAVVELDAAPVAEDKGVVLIAGEEVGIRSKEFLHFGRDTSGFGRFTAWLETENGE